MFALCFLRNVKLFPFVAAPFILVAFLACNYCTAAENQLADVATLLKVQYNTIQLQYMCAKLRRKKSLA